MSTISYYLLKDWIKRFSNDEIALINSIIFKGKSINNVIMGYRSEEEVANDYFYALKNTKTISAYLKELTIRDNIYYLLIVSDEIITSRVYENYNLAKEQLFNLKDSLYPSIQAQIEEFKSELGVFAPIIDITVTREEKSNLHQYSFNIFLNNKIFEKRAFILSAADTLEDIANINMLSDELINNYNATIISISKKLIEHKIHYLFDIKINDIVKKLDICISGKYSNIEDYLKEIL